MQPLLPTPHETFVTNEYDVIVLRQSLRQIARQLGLSLVKQASFTAAVSEVARNVLDQRWKMLFAIHVHQVELRQALEVQCHRPKDELHPSHHDFESRITVQAARQLLDETSFDSSSDQPRLILRMWI